MKIERYHDDKTVHLSIEQVSYIIKVSEADRNEMILASLFLRVNGDWCKDAVRVSGDSLSVSLLPGTLPQTSVLEQVWQWVRHIRRAMLLPYHSFECGRYYIVADLVDDEDSTTMVRIYRGAEPTQLRTAQVSANRMSRNDGTFKVYADGSYYGQYYDRNDALIAAIYATLSDAYDSDMQKEMENEQ